MSLVQYCIDYVLDGPNDISLQALRLAFDDTISGLSYPQYTSMEYDSNYNIEQGIREKVIYKMIGKMINASGGVTEVIDLSTSRIRYLGNGIIHVNVPDTVTGGREILSVIAVYPGTIGSMLMYGSGNGMARCGNGGAIGNSLNSIAKNLTNDHVVSSYSNITKTGRNSFIIKAAGMLLFTMSAKVILSYDEEFSVISPKAYEYFGDLTVLGTKAYIYKHCRRGLKEAVRRFGFSVDELQDEIDGYADAHREYSELYTKIKKILAYADSKGVSDHINMIVPRRLR